MGGVGYAFGPCDFEHGFGAKDREAQVAGVVRIFVVLLLLLLLLQEWHLGIGVAGECSFCLFLNLLPETFNAKP